MRRPANLHIPLISGSSDGFTLFEMMIGATLMAMLGVILATATSSLINAIRATRVVQEDYHTARVALGRMGRELGMAYVSKHQSEDRTTKTLFVGKANTITFSYMGHRSMVRNSFESDEGVVEYKVEREAKTGENVLVRREKVVIDDTPLRGGRRQVLATRVKKLTFAYWDMDKESWQSDWRVEIDRLQQEKQAKDAAAALATGLTGNAELGKALADMKNQDKKHGPDELWLPARIRIQLTLETDDGELAFETQARVRLMEAVDFNSTANLKAYETSLSPYGIAPITPAGFSVLPATGAGATGATGATGGTR